MTAKPAGRSPRSQEHPYVAVDVVTFTVADGELKTLLVRVSDGPLAGQWAFPGGIVRLDESPDDAAKRELRETTGVKSGHIEQLYTFGGPDRDPRARIVSVAYLALRPSGAPLRPWKRKYPQIAEFSVRKLPRLAYDHNRIARLALERLAAKLTYTNIAYALLPATFTLGEIQSVYELILGRRLDRRNFRRKLLALGLLVQAPGTRRGSHRPAALYAFRDRRPMVLQIL